MTSSSSAVECLPYVEQPAGRQGIGVTQPQSGVDYPLQRPSEDVRFLLADFHISFDAPESPFTRPFSLYWLYGFGCDTGLVASPEFVGHGDSSSSSWQPACSPIYSSVSGSSESVGEDCLPTPAHAFDVIVKDANGQIVFDSTTAGTSMTTKPWGNRLQVVVWQSAAGVICRAVAHTAWGPTDETRQRQYPIYFFPDRAVLNDRTVDQLPKRLRSLTVLLDQLRQTPVNLTAGYNMRIDVAAQPATSGRRRVTRLTFNAVPGAGLGTFPDCEPQPLYIRKINNVRPTDTGHFSLAAADCYWIRPPTTVVSESPRTTLPATAVSPGNIPTPGLPHAAAGTAKNLPGWPEDDSPDYAQLQIGNDCAPCVDCEDYVAAAKYMNKTAGAYRAAGASAEQTRDTYALSRDRWLAYAACVQQRPLRVRLLPQLCPFIDVAAQFCNQGTTCYTNLELGIALSTSPTGGEGEAVPGYTFIHGASAVPGRKTGRDERYDLGGDWPNYSAFFDTILPGQSVYVRFRLKFSDCGLSDAAGGDTATPYAVTATVTASENGNSLSLYDELTEEHTEVSAAADQTLKCPIDEASVVNMLICACEQ